MTTRFRYRAATPEGRVVEGLLQAPSQQSALEELHRQRLYPVAVEEVAAREARQTQRSLGRHAAVTLWSRTAATLLGAGVPLDRVLAFTVDHAGNQQLALALRQIRRRVQGGASLADAFAEHPRLFSPLIIAMVAAGESTGALDVVFERISEHLEEAAELRSQVRTALVYPALMAAVASVGVATLLLFVVPRFSAILEEAGGQLPATTRVLVGASLLLTEAWWLWLALGVAAAFGAYSAFQRPEVRRGWHAWRLSIPWVGDLERKYATARFARTLGLLLRSGIPVLPALRIAHASASNALVSEGIQRAAVAVAEGSALTPALEGTLPPLALQMLAVGEESGKLEDLCIRVADTYDGEVRRVLRTAVAMIEPIMILVFGALVGFVALAMLQAIYSVNSASF